MCGIIGVFNHGDKEQTANDEVLEILQDQISRGKEGFGISFIDKDRKVDTKRATIAAKAIIDLYHEPNQKPSAIMHHRMPTSSENKLSQTHPIRVEDGSLKHNYLVIHNGVVRNCDDLREEHEKLGFVYTTPRMRKWYQSEEEEYNDSESLAIEVARLVEGQTKRLDVEGSAAFIALQINKKSNTVKRVYFGRNDSNPLKLAATRGKITLSSEGKGDNIKPFFLYHFSLTDYKIKKQKLKFQKEEKKEEEKEETKTHEFLPSTDLPTTEVTGYEVNKDVPVDLSDAFDDNILAAESLLADYFEIIGDESKMLTEDLDTLLRDTTKGLLLELREAKDKASDAFQDVFYDQTMEEAEQVLAREQEVAEEAGLTGGVVDKLSSK